MNGLQLSPDLQFVQDNHSKSIQGTLRGLHYQLKQTQGKFIRVLQGEIFDAVVDIRKRLSYLWPMHRGYLICR